MPSSEWVTHTLYGSQYCLKLMVPDGYWGAKEVLIECMADYVRDGATFSFQNQSTQADQFVSSARKEEYTVSKEGTPMKHICSISVWILLP